MTILSIILTFVLDIIPAGEAFVRQVTARDSILIADRLEYGVELSGVEAIPAEDFALGFPDIEGAFNDTLVCVCGWQIDTVKLSRKERLVKAGVLIAPFEPGRYHLPELYVQLQTPQRTDTLLFSAPEEFEVKLMSVDTASFVPHDLKDQIKYPLTAQEILVPTAIGLGGGALIVLAIIFILGRIRKREGKVEVPRDPAHIVALRELDRYRSDKFWAPEKQKTFYSGITDTLKVYIDDRFGVDAPEMTTAELFAAIKDNKDIPGGLYAELKSLFETADFVKFAKATADDATNAAALPLAIRFVTTTYQSQVEAESGAEAAKEN